MSASAPVAARIGRPQGPLTAIPPITDEDPRCDVCPHPVADHDAIGLRFCRATRNAGTDRGCACR
jgi:hypothetical protein